MQFELEMIKGLQSISNEFLNLLASLISFLGEQYTLIILAALIYFVIDKEFGETYCFTTLFSNVMNGVMKLIINRPRPFVKDPDVKNLKESTATGSSFPSGHSQGASAMYFTIANHYKKKLFWVIASVIVFLVMFSRIYLGAHYLTDTLAGCALGLVFCFLCPWLYSKFNKTPEQKLIFFGVISLVLLPVAIGFAIGADRATILLRRDFYTGYGCVLALGPTVYIENKLTKFEKVDLKWRLLRFVLSLVFILGTYFGLVKLWPNKIIILDMIRYFSIVFIGVGVYPLIFRNTRLFRNKNKAKEEKADTIDAEVVDVKNSNEEAFGIDIIDK